MKKTQKLTLLLSLLFISLLLLSMVSGQTRKLKIGIITGTVAQGEDEYRAAERVIARYGADRVIHRTYPDNFMAEQETTISLITSLAADPNVKVIVISQAVPGSLAALRKVKEVRPDVLIGFVSPHEDPELVNKEADFAIDPDQRYRGRSIIRQAKKMGAKVFIHYSFPRHMSYPLLAERRRIMEEECKVQGIQFVFVTAPDPLGEGGLPAAQQFILEDVPRQLAKYGPKTAFFSTNCGMQEPLIKAILQHGGIFVEQCCPSPTHGYPGALGIKIPPEKKGDMKYILEQIKKAIAEKGGSGRFATWPAPVSIVNTLASVDYLVAVAEGRAKKGDRNLIRALLMKHAEVPVTLNKYKETGNLYLVVLGSVVF